MSSPDSSNSSKAKGGVLDVFRISNFSIITSILPLGILGLIDSASRLFNLPFTASTYSLRTCSANLKSSGIFSLRATT